MDLGTVFRNPEKHEFSDNHKLHFRGSMYRFGPSRVAGKEDSQRQTKQVYERFSKSIEKQG